MRNIAKPDSEWSRGLLAVVLAHSLLMQALTFSLRPALSYAALEAGLPTAALGLLSAAFALPGLLLAIPVGRATDRVGERRIAAAGGALMLAGAVVAFAWHSTAITLVVATAVFGCGHMLAAIGIQTLLANRAPATRRDSIFGSYAFAIALGQGAGGALLAIGAGDSAMPDIPLQLALALALGAGCLVLPLFIPRLRHDGTEVSLPAPEPLARLLGRPAVLRAILASALVVAAVEVSLVYLPALGYERGFSATVVSGMLVARSIAAMVSRLGLGWQVRAVGRRRLMVGSIAVSAVSLIALALPLDALWIIALCALFGLGNGLCQPLTLSWLSEIAPRGQRAALTSLRLATVRIAQIALPTAAGSLSILAGAGGVLAATGAMVGTAAWLAAAITDRPAGLGAEPKPGLEQ